MLFFFFENPVVFTFSESGLFFSFSLFLVLTCCKLGALDFIILPVVNYLVEFA
jgi:hypothetical protein